MGDLKLGLTTQQYPDLYLGVTSGPGKEKFNYALTGPTKSVTGTSWIMRQLAGKVHLLIKDGGSAGGQVITFRGEREYLTLQPYEPGNIQQHIVVTPLGDTHTLVVLNNHDETNVMDRSMYDKDAGWVIAFPWNRGDNQIWKMHFYN